MAKSHMTLPTTAHFTLRFAVTAEPLSSSMEDIVNLLAGKMAGRHQVIDASLRFGAPQSQPCGQRHTEEQCFHDCLRYPDFCPVPSFQARLHSGRGL
ncbi:MAG: hypothetical protein FD157_3162 [Rhodocyclaceae bacterium]|nr:MAG: hypothetical protein FD157_3162 [Rhodocyclaceae bacterium]TND00440.1 MAG: hypothetical protein FD118_3141 [Rhodocyclaceae bacterium]